VVGGLESGLFGAVLSSSVTGENSRDVEDDRGFLEGE
jgi:hypothetical protein